MSRQWNLSTNTLFRYKYFNQKRMQKLAKKYVNKFLQDALSPKS